MALVDCVRRIKKWYEAHEASAIVSNLRAGATQGALQAVKEQGFMLTEEMEQLYSLHDGQPDWERNYFLPNAGFMELTSAIQETNHVLENLFGCPSGHRTPQDEWKGHGLDGAADDLMVDEEWTPAWFCFGCGTATGDFLVQNFHSRRVFLWHRKGEVVLLGDSLEHMLIRFADDLDAGRVSLSGDPNLSGVVEEGFNHVERYVCWSP